MNAGVLVLAAGRASRFRADKRLAELPRGGHVIDTLLDNIRASGLDFLVCLGADDHSMAARLGAANVCCLLCTRAAEGMGGTLAEASGQIPGWDGVLVALADMPWIAADTYRAVASRLSADSICVPVFNGSRGHPVGFGSSFFAELQLLGGDVGARQLVRVYEGRVVELPVTDPAIHRDIDFPADLEGG